MLHNEFHLTGVHLFATGLWVAAVSLWALSWATDQIYLAGLALILTGAAATASVRGFLLTHEEQMKTALAVTGRDVSVLDRQP